MEKYGDRIINPVDFAYEEDGRRVECGIDQLPAGDVLILDIGAKTIRRYIGIISSAVRSLSTDQLEFMRIRYLPRALRRFGRAIADSNAFTVIGGGESVSAAHALGGRCREAIRHICTAGGAMVRYLSGSELPVLKALRRHTAQRPKWESTGGNHMLGVH